MNVTLSFLFFGMCVAAFILEMVCFRIIREISPVSYESIGRPSAFFHGLNFSVVRYFVTGRFHEDENLRPYARVFWCLSLTYLTGYLLFGLLCLEILRDKGTLPT